MYYLPMVHSTHNTITQQGEPATTHAYQFPACARNSSRLLSQFSPHVGAESSNGLRAKPAGNVTNYSWLHLFGVYYHQLVEQLFENGHWFKTNQCSSFKVTPLMENEREWRRFKEDWRGKWGWSGSLLCRYPFRFGGQRLDSGVELLRKGKNGWIFLDFKTF